MKHSELIRELKKAGCLLKRHGASHDIWINPKNGARTAVPRHGSKEIKEATAMAILDDLLND
jgi:mRNA interferase HicA